MSSSDVGICNVALVRLGATTIQALDDGTDIATRCRVIYPFARDKLLSSAYWPFAKRVVQLAEVDVDSPEYNYAYQIPSSCLQPVEVIGTTRRTDWEQQGQYIFSNLYPFYLGYIEKVSNVGLMSINFRAALTYAIQGELTYALVSDKKLAEAMRTTAVQEILLAQANDMNIGNEYTRQQRMYVDNFVNPDAGILTEYTWITESDS